MPEERERIQERDLVLTQGQYANILDSTKGGVIVYVGPNKSSLGNTDWPVYFDEDERSFRKCQLEQAIKQSPLASEGWYIVLHNPAIVSAGSELPEHPAVGSNPTPVRLRNGCKVNIPGPITFPLWPSQIAKVIEGHNLRFNQYVLVRVYDETAARENWGKAIKVETRESSEAKIDALIPDLTIGKQLIIKGEDVSFYIPPTGIEVVPDERMNFVRDAVSLERLEYCILLDEDGNKIYVQGPDVVFPKPTETFVEKNGLRKFRAIELNPLMGLYIKVIADYKDEQGAEHRAGEELFFTGKDQQIYFPRPEHALIRYGEQEIHYAVAIPEGEARYVLDRKTGKVELVKGPLMFLPDPRNEVIVRRALSLQEVKLWYPGNEEALAYNEQLMATTTETPAGNEREIGRSVVLRGGSERKESMSVLSDEFARGTKFTAPRTITLDTKYEGAVTINVWTGYAVQIVSKSGSRKVVIGPQTILLEYDENLEKIFLSTGTPKSDARLMETVYLRVLHNTVSDLVRAETKDLCPVQIKLSYRVNFEGEPEKWFNVENYVKFLTDHLRSMLRNSIKQHGIEEFYANSTNIVRDTVLGISMEGKRTGRIFEENGMRIYDVEVLEVSIEDEGIEGMLVNAQKLAVQQALELVQQERVLEATRKGEVIRQETAQAKAETAIREIVLKVQNTGEQLKADLAKVEAEEKVVTGRLDLQLAEQGLKAKIEEGRLALEKEREEQTLAFEKSRQEQQLVALKAETEALVEKVKAVSPDLAAAIREYGDKKLAGELAEHLSVLSILKDEGVVDIFKSIFQGTVVANVFETAFKVAPAITSSRTPAS